MSEKTRKTPGASGKKNPLPQALTPRDYVARADGWVGGRRVAKGDTITMTPAQARYERLLEAK